AVAEWVTVAVEGHRRGSVCRWGGANRSRLTQPPSTTFDNCSQDRWLRCLRRGREGTRPNYPTALCPRATAPQSQIQGTRYSRPPRPFSPASLPEPFRGELGVAVHTKTPGKPTAPRPRRRRPWCPRPG